MSEFNLDEFFGSLPYNHETYFNGDEKFRSDTPPEVYYIGKGKTGSSSLVRNIKGKKTAHWHSTRYYELVNKAKDCLSKRNLTIYDYIEWVNQNIHPVKVIEAYRDPIAQYISALYQWFGPIEVDKIRAMIDVRYPDITFQKELEKPDSPLEVIYLKTEDSKNWPEILKTHGIEYKNIIFNRTKHKSYAEAIQRIKFPVWQLDIIYGKEKIQKLYTKKEIEQFYEKWSY